MQRALFLGEHHEGSLEGADHGAFRTEHDLKLDSSPPPSLNGAQHPIPLLWDGGQALRFYLGSGRLKILHPAPLDDQVDVQLFFFQKFLMGESPGCQSGWGSGATTEEGLTVVGVGRKRCLQQDTPAIGPEQLHA